jgi:hypothetical protein
MQGGTSLNMVFVEVLILYWTAQTLLGTCIACAPLTFSTQFAMDQVIFQGQLLGLR